MKLRKKLASILCAAALLVSALPAANAVSAEPLSDAAGETVTVHVTYAGADGQLTQSYVEVAIPENATSKEERELVHAAALATVKSPARSAQYSNFDYLCQRARVSVTSSYKNIDRINFRHDYDELLFDFNGGVCSGNPTNLTLRVKDRNNEVIELDAALEEQSATSKTAEVLIVSGDSYGGVSMEFNNGQYINADVKVDQGSAVFSGVIVKGYY